MPPPSAPNSRPPILTLNGLRFGLHTPPTDLTLHQGETLALFGDDPHALSTLLDTIAGHAPPLGGTIHRQGQDITTFPPEHRRIGTISARDPLFPHLDVTGNIAFAARASGQDRDTTAAATRRALALLGLDAIAQARTRSLTPEQAFRVSLARQIVHAPHILLLDDPFARFNSAPARKSARALLNTIAQALSLSLIHATHDREEALRTGGDIAVFAGETLLQRAPAATLLDRPADDRVATLFGDANALRGRVLELEDDIARIRLASGGFAEALAMPGLEADMLCTLCIRPDRIAPLFSTHTASTQDEEDAPLTATLQTITHLGDHVRLTLRLPDGEEIEIRRPPLQAQIRARPGATAQLAWQAGHAMAFPMRADLY